MTLASQSLHDGVCIDEDRNERRRANRAAR